MYLKRHAFGTVTQNIQYVKKQPQSAVVTQRKITLTTYEFK